MTRRHTLALTALCALPAIAQSKPEETSMYDDIFKTSLETKKGLTFFVKGNSIAGIVVKLLNGAVEVRNQTYGRIIIKLDSIDAIALA